MRPPLRIIFYNARPSFLAWRIHGIALQRRWWTAAHIGGPWSHTMVRARLTARSRRNAGGAYTARRFPPIVITGFHGWGSLLVSLRRAIPRHFGRTIDAARGGARSTAPVIAGIKRRSSRLGGLWATMAKRTVVGSILHPWRRMNGTSICGTCNSRGGSRRWIRRCMARCGLAGGRRGAAKHRRDGHTPTRVGSSGYGVERRQFSR